MTLICAFFGTELGNLRGKWHLLRPINIISLLYKKYHIMIQVQRRVGTIIDVLSFQTQAI